MQLHRTALYVDDSAGMAMIGSGEPRLRRSTHLARPLPVRWARTWLRSLARGSYVARGFTQSLG